MCHPRRSSDMEQQPLTVTCHVRQPPAEVRAPYQSHDLWREHLASDNRRPCAPTHSCLLRHTHCRLDMTTATHTCAPLLAPDIQVTQPRTARDNLYAWTSSATAARHSPGSLAPRHMCGGGRQPATVALTCHPHASLGDPVAQPPYRRGRRQGTGGI